MKKRGFLADSALAKRYEAALDAYLKLPFGAKKAMGMLMHFWLETDTRLTVLFSDMKRKTNARADFGPALTFAQREDARMAAYTFAAEILSGEGAIVTAVLSGDGESAEVFAVYCKGGTVFPQPAEAVSRMLTKLPGGPERLTYAGLPFAL